MTMMFVIIGVAGMMALVVRMVGHHLPVRHKVQGR
jgi:hypothetical protein